MRSSFYSFQLETNKPFAHNFKQTITCKGYRRKTLSHERRKKGVVPPIKTQFCFSEQISHRTTTRELGHSGLVAGRADQLLRGLCAKQLLGTCGVHVKQLLVTYLCAFFAGKWCALLCMMQLCVCLHVYVHMHEWDVHCAWDWVRVRACMYTRMDVHCAYEIGCVCIGNLFYLCAGGTTRTSITSSWNRTSACAFDLLFCLFLYFFIYFFSFHFKLIYFYFILKNSRHHETEQVRALLIYFFCLFSLFFLNLFISILYLRSWNRPSVYALPFSSSFSLYFHT